MKQVGWAIKGTYGIYVGWRLTRKEMIENHIKDTGRTWDYCRRKGDRAIKIIIKEFRG